MNLDSVEVLGRGAELCRTGHLSSYETGSGTPFMTPQGRIRAETAVCIRNLKTKKDMACCHILFCFAATRVELFIFFR